MRRIVLLLASIALAVIFVSGVALADSPTTKADCKKGGYAKYGFKNQGQCIEAVVVEPPPQAGTLDTSFGTDGITISTAHEWIKDIAWQDDGKIVAVGFLPTREPGIFRYNADGSLDNTFGDNGVVAVPSGAGYGEGINVLVQPDGKIVVSGYTVDNNIIEPFIARYNADGSFDRQFAPISSGQSSVDGMELVAGGKLVAVTQNGYLARFNPDGTLDATFANGGQLLIPSQQLQFGLTVQPDGRILTTGATTDGAGHYISTVHRFTENGALDTSFSGDGIQTINGTEPGKNGSSGRAITVQPDGKIVVAGEANSASGEDVLVYRLNADGSLDNAFGSNGMIIRDMGYSYVTDIMLHPDGKITAVGLAQKGYTPGLVWPDGGREDFMALRFNANGTLDTSFGNSGEVIIEMETVPNAGSAALAGLLQPDGKTVLGGYVDTDSATDSALLRLN